MKELCRLLRFIGHAACRVAPAADAAMITLVRPDGARAAFADTLAREAAMRGLARYRPDLIAATKEARSFLRRAIAAREEAHLDQHRRIEIGMVIEAETPRPVRINAAESPLALLTRLKDKAGAAWFPAEAVAAGERLARDFQFAALQPRITQSFTPHIGSNARNAPGTGVDMHDNVVAARMRVNKAVTAMGPELSGAALDICCFEKGLETVERERQWPARSAKLMLKTALLLLHRHYHPAPPHDRARHAWGADGFRPDLERG